MSLRLGLTVAQAAHSCHLILPLDSRTKVRSLSQGNSAQRRDCSDMDYLELVCVCVCVCVCIHPVCVCIQQHLEGPKMGLCGWEAEQEKESAKRSP